jgi:EmrB/QacA subfamily drug resistance transporter
VFIGGLALFSLSSLAGGLAQTSTALVAARAVQGLGGALLLPAALSILTVTFPAGRDRNVAMGVWGALAGLGGTLGVVAGGVLVDALGWQSVFFVNVPVGALLVALAPLFVRESRAAQPATRSFDVGGAVLGTAGLLALVLGVIRAEPLGWSSAEVIALLAGGVVLLSAFVVVERRAAAPLLPMRLFRSRGLQTASPALALNGAAFLGMFFLTAIYLQQVRGDSALAAGVQFLPMGAAAIVAAVLASRLVSRIGTRPIHLAGALLSVAGLWLLTGVNATDAYAASVLPGTLLFGAGIMFVGVPNQIAAVVDVQDDDAGAASGVLSSVYQVGGALGLAIITTLSATRVTDALAGGATQAAALTAGYHRGLVVAAALAAVNAMLGLAAPRLRPNAEQALSAAAA